MGPVTASTVTASVQALVHFCSSTSLGVGASDQSLLKSVVCNTQYVSRESLFKSMFGADSYVDWDALAAAHRRSEGRKKGNPVGDATIWCTLLGFVSGDRQALIKTQQQQQHSGGVASGLSIRTRYRPFFIVHQAVEAGIGKEDFGRGPLAADAVLAISVRAFFILNLVGIVPMPALDLLLGTSIGKAVTQQAQSIMIQVLSEKFTPAQYEVSGGVFCLERCVWYQCFA